ncbi:MAG: SDR family oxidoreductase [Actinobacteria bacterium]|nr:SDR family oxidoreductase [Actinomycetota bacterium]
MTSPSTESAKPSARSSWVRSPACPTRSPSNRRPEVVVPASTTQRGAELLGNLGLVELAHRTGREHRAPGVAVLADQLARFSEGPQQQQAHRDLVGRARVVDVRPTLEQGGAGEDLVEPAFSDHRVVIDHDALDVDLEDVALLTDEVAVVHVHRVEAFRAGAAPVAGDPEVERRLGAQRAHQPIEVGFGFRDDVLAHAFEHGAMAFVARALDALADLVPGLPSVDHRPPPTRLRRGIVAHSASWRSPSTPRAAETGAKRSRPHCQEFVRIARTMVRGMQGLVMGKTAIVAGGGRGIGEAISLVLADAGAAVMVVDKVAERAERVTAEVTARGGRACALVANLRDDAELAAIVPATVDAFGAVDILVNVAGGMRAGWRPLRESEASDWDFVFRQNVRWVQLLSVAAADRMVAQGAGGSIVSIGSVSGVFGAPNHAAYGAAKAALIHLMKSLALEYGRFGVRANAVSPGSIRTPAVAGLITPEQQERDDLTTALGRAGTPDDIARAVLFFASDLARFVTGQMLVVDGGATVRFPLLSPGAHPSESLT